MPNVRKGADLFPPLLSSIIVVIAIIIIIVPRDCFKMFQTAVNKAARGHWQRVSKAEQHVFRPRQLCGIKCWKR